MTNNPKHPTEKIVSVRRMASGAEVSDIQVVGGRVETVVTAPSTVDAINRAVEAYPRALKNLAKR